MHLRKCLTFGVDFTIRRNGMKTKNLFTKTLLTLLCVCTLMLGFIGIGSITAYAAEGDVAIDATNFPDGNFRAWITANIAGADDSILTADELAAVTEIDVSDKDIQSLTGIEHFTALEKLVCQNNQLTSLDVSANTALTWLDCRGNQLNSLDLSANVALETLYCINNPSMASLNVSGTALTELNCYNNNLTSLDVSNISTLRTIHCYNNELEYLNVNGCTELRELSCFNNNLTSLDLRDTSINRLYCYGNQLMNLELPANATMGYCNCDSQKAVTITINEKAWYTLPSEVDASKVTVTSGAMLDGNVLKNILGNEVIYTYDTGLEGKDLTVTLTVDDPHTHTFDASTHLCACGTVGNHTFVDGICPCSAVEISATNFPDANFRAWITANIAGADDGVLTAAELAAVTSISVDYERIADLKGIEHFTEITILECFHNNLKSLDVSMLPLLEKLDCRGNELTSLNLSNNTALQYLYCDSNYLTSLDLSANTELKELTCENNCLAYLDLSGNTKLTYFDATGSYQTVYITIDQATMTASLPAGVKAENVSKLENATLNGNVLTVDEGAENVCYEYFCGLMGVNNSMDVALTIENPHTHATSGKCDCGVVVINDTNFPDNNFRNYVSTDFDTDGNGILIPTELAAVTAIEYTDGTNRIANFTGIEHFTELTEFKAQSQTVETLDLSKNVKLTVINLGWAQSLSTLTLPTNAPLTYLYMQACLNIKSIDVSSFTALEYLNIVNTKITDIDLGNNTELTELWCGSRLGSINLESNTKLKILNVNNCGLTSLDVSKNTALEELYCLMNQLTALDLSNNTALKVLYCNDNHLSALDLSNNTNLLSVYCRNNNLMQLNISSTAPLDPASFDADGQTATVTLNGNSLDLTRIDPNFDGSKATSNTTGASFNGNTLVLANDMTTVTYTYAIGNGNNALNVTLAIEYVDYGAEIEAIEKELNDAITELNTIIGGKATPAEIQSAVDTLTEAYENADEALKLALQGKIDVNTTAITNLQTALTNAESTLDTAIKKVAADLETAKNDLQSQIDTLTTSVGTNATDIAELEKAISDLDAAYQAADIIINSRLDALENSLTTVKSELEAAIAQVRKNLVDAKAELEAKDNELARKDNELEAKDAELSAAIESLNTTTTVLIVILSVIGVISIGIAAVTVTTFGRSFCGKFCR